MQTSHKKQACNNTNRATAGMQKQELVRATSNPRDARAIRPSTRKKTTKGEKHWQHTHAPCTSKTRTTMGANNQAATILGTTHVSRTYKGGRPRRDTNFNRPTRKQNPRPTTSFQNHSKTSFLKSHHEFRKEARSAVCNPIRKQLTFS